MAKSVIIDAIYLKQLRESESLSQEAVADEIGMTRRRYLTVENSGRTSPETMTKLAQFFKVPLDKLVKGDEEDIFSQPYWYQCHSWNHARPSIGQLFDSPHELVKQIEQDLQYACVFWDDFRSQNISASFALST